MTPHARTRHGNAAAQRPAPAEQAADPRRDQLPSLVAVLLGCALYVAMALHGVAHKSGTSDEFVHVTAGYSYWTLGDYRLNPENGNWSQRLLALPIVAKRLGANGFPWPAQDAWHRADMWSLSERFFFERGRDADALLLRSRVVVAIIGALLGALVFYWSRSLFGFAGACTTLALYVFSPTMLAHGALATSDVIGAAFFAAALWTFWRVLHRVTPLSVAASLASVGGLFLAKPSAPLFVPIALAMLAVQLLGAHPVRVELAGSRIVAERGRRAKLFGMIAVAHALVAFVLIWVSYGFRYSAFAPGSAAGDRFIESWASILDTPGVVVALAEWGRRHQVLPEAYLYGLANVVAYSRERMSFLNGAVRRGGSAEFFPYAVLVKTTVPALLLTLAIPFALTRRRADVQARAFWTATLYPLTPLLAGIIIYGLSALSTSLNIGHRHLLPIIPLVMVLAGSVGSRAFGTERWSWSRMTVRARLRAAAVGTLLVWHATESVRIAPDYLAYFNVMAGGPSQGYRHLVDSSLDWGQDLPTLKDWLDRHGLQGAEHPPVYLSYFGTALPSYYGIDATPLAGFPDRWTPHEPEPLTAGVYCFSATMLQGLYFMTPGAWIAQYENDYQSMLYNLKLFDSTSVNPAARQALLRQTGEEFWVKNFRAFEHFRTARIAAYLRKREPDAEIGYSILVYRVSDEELARALSGPAPQ